MELHRLVDRRSLLKTGLTFGVAGLIGVRSATAETQAVKTPDDADLRDTMGPAEQVGLYLRFLDTVVQEAERAAYDRTMAEYASFRQAATKLHELAEQLIATLPTGQGTLEFGLLVASIRPLAQSGSAVAAVPAQDDFEAAVRQMQARLPNQLSATQKDLLARILVQARRMDSTRESADKGFEEYDATRRSIREAAENVAEELINCQVRCLEYAQLISKYQKDQKNPSGWEGRQDVEVAVRQAAGHLSSGIGFLASKELASSESRESLSLLLSTVEDRLSSSPLLASVESGAAQRRGMGESLVPFTLLSQVHDLLRRYGPPAEPQRTRRLCHSIFDSRKLERSRMESHVRAAVAALSVPASAYQVRSVRSNPRALAEKLVDILQKI